MSPLKADLGQLQTADSNLFQLAWSLIQVDTLNHELIACPNEVAARRLLDCFQNGFTICYSGPHVLCQSNNFKSIRGREDIRQFEALLR